MKINVMFDSLEEFQSFMKMSQQEGAPEEATASAATEDVPDVEEPKVEMPSQPAPVDLPVPEPVVEAVKTVTRDEVTKKCISLMDAGKQAQLLNLLQQFGAPSLPGLADDKLNDFYKALQEVA